MPHYTTTLDAQGVLENGALERLGGKGKSLATMASAGFNVPRAFLVTTSAYRSFVSDNDLQHRIIELARPSVVDNRVSFDEGSDNVQALFAAGDLAPNIVEEVASAYRALGDAPPVAVRSSANAEDLPDLSFAGQQETYLNVRGEDQVVAAMRACWASLWTARALDYRHQNGIDQNSVAMAVVVQVMVPSAVSGILFTANPANGERAEMIVNASFGLGEAVVSGEVTPDTYIVDRATGEPKETIIGPKEQMTVSAGNQGTRMERVSLKERDQSSLTNEMVKELYLTEGLEFARRGVESMMHGGGAHFVTCNGYAYCRADHKGMPTDPTMAPEDMEALAQRMLDEIRQRQGPVTEKEAHDMALFLSELSAEDRAAFQNVAQSYQSDDLAHDLTMPKSDNPTYIANHKTEDNDRRWKSWQDEAMPRLVATAEKWREVDIPAATDEELLAGIREMAIEEGFYLDRQHEPYVRHRQVHGRRRNSRAKVQRNFGDTGRADLLAVPLPAVVRPQIQSHQGRDRVLLRLHVAHPAPHGVRAGPTHGGYRHLPKRGRHLLSQDRRAEAGHRGAPTRSGTPRIRQDRRRTQGTAGSPQAPPPTGDDPRGSEQHPVGQVQGDPDPER